MRRVHFLSICVLVFAAILISSPAWATDYSLDAVDGDPIDAVYVDEAGNVGIGTTNPSANLTVKGNLSQPLSGLVYILPGSSTVTGVDTLFTKELKAGDSIQIGPKVSTVNQILSDSELILDSSHPTGAWNAPIYTGSNLFSVKTSNDEEQFVIDNSGNVGIGTTAPNQKLDVQGGAQFGSGNVNLVNSVGKIPGITSSYFSSLDGSAITNVNADSVANGLYTTTSFRGDVSGTYNALSVSNDSHYHTASTISGLGVSDFFSSNISQWTNDIGYLRGNSTISGLVRSTAWGNSYFTGGNVGIGTTSPAVRLQVNGGDINLKTQLGEKRIDFGGGVRESTDAYIHMYDGIERQTIKLSANIGVDSYFNAGNVGIGKTNPTEKLDVAGTVKATTFVGDGSQLTGISGSGKWSDGTRGIYYNSGDVGIGTKIPTDLLTIDIQNNPGPRMGGLNINDGFGNRVATLTDNSTDSSTSGTLNLYRNGSVNIHFNSYPNFPSYINAGNVGIGTTSPQGKLDVHGDIYHYNSKVHSDERLKKEIKPLEDSLDKIAELQGVSYKWRTEEYPGMEFSDDIQIGLLAQEMEEVIPELVYTDNNGYKSISYERLTAILVEAIKELKTKNEVLMARISALEAK